MKNEKMILLQGGSHAVILFHGLSSTPLEFKHLAKTIHKAGFTVCVPVLEGYSIGTKEMPMESWIDAALAVFDQFSGQYEQVSVGGLSMGATLAAAVCVRRTHVQTLILLSITLNYDGWTIPRYHFLLDLLYFTPLRRLWRYKEAEPFGLKNETLRKRIARAMAKHHLSEIGPSSITLSALFEANRLRRAVKKQVGQIQSDCCIIHAVDDDTAGPMNAVFVRDHIASQYIRFVMLDNSYHMITSDNERDVVAREVVTFLLESSQNQRIK